MKGGTIDIRMFVLVQSTSEISKYSNTLSNIEYTDTYFIEDILFVIINILLSDQGHACSL